MHVNHPTNINGEVFLIKSGFILLSHPQNMGEKMLLL